MIRARFVGVGRFQEPAFSELAGCTRDATALHALFVDSLEPATLDAQLLLNEQATAEAIRSALTDTLDVATPDDAVVLTFATHGTPSHYLVAHATSESDLARTAIPMAELADRFTRSRAGQILLVLDACFGGAAPARVVPIGAMSRGLFDLSAFTGEGRLIVSASAWDQPCYEHPARRHGLLSEALIDALIESDTLSALSLTDAVVARVRSEAAKLGELQDPTVAGSIQGSFALPRLRRGAVYEAAFPEYKAIRVAVVDDLVRFAIAPEIVAQWNKRFENNLHDLQLEAINERRVLDGESLFVVAPTSSGKTFIGEMAAVRAVTAGQKAVFLLPFKALTNQKYDEFRRSYGERCGMRVIRCTGDHNDDIGQLLAGRYDIALLTYEMFLGLALRNLALLHLVGLVVIDEAQFIADPGRGITVELLLTFLRSLRDRGINPQLILLSATVGGLNAFDAWLGIGTLMSERRPVPLDFGVFDRTGVYEYLTQDGEHREEQLVPRVRIYQRKQKPSSQDVLVPLVQQLVAAPDETVIVFRNRRGPAQGCAEYLGRETGLAPADAAVAALPQLDTSSASSQLRSALVGGAAFHTSNLSRDEREAVEHFFERGEGIRILVGTSGVSAGINTPASTVIIAETAWAAPGNPPMSVGDVRNMAGRAGRLGYRATGRAIILADTTYQRKLLFQRYVQARPEALQSSFSSGNIGTWTLRLLAQVSGIPRGAVGKMIANTYGGYLLASKNPAASAHVSEQSLAYVARFVQLGLAREVDERIELTDLGRACGASHLSIDSCLQILQVIRRGASLSNSALLALTQALREMDEQYVPMQSRGSGETQWVDAALASLGPFASVLQQNAESAIAVARRAKRFLLAKAWIEGQDVTVIEARFTGNPFFAIGRGDIVGVAEASRFRLSSVYDIAARAVPSSVPSPAEFEAFLVQLEFGIPAVAVPLIQLGGLQRGELLAISRLDISTPEALWALPPAGLEQLPRALAVKLEKLRPRPKVDTLAASSSVSARV